MPKTNHTPGPWHRGELPVRDPKNGNLPTVYIWDEGENNYIAAVCDEDGNGHATDANANLIASAPELLDFAKAFVQCFSKDGQFNSITADYGTEELHEMARNAIRKSKGGA